MKLLATIAVTLMAAALSGFTPPKWSLPPPIPTTGTIYVEGHKAWWEGGSIPDFERMVDGAIARGQSVVINDVCTSACTLWLKMPPGRICTTGDNIPFLFHYVTDFGDRPLPAATRSLLSKYPENVRAAIKAKGGLTAKLVRVMAVDVIPLCKK
jgi:hypothetical protein